MRIIIAHQTVAVHDAIGNDIEQMYMLLNRRSECYVYAENTFRKTLKYISKDQLEDFLKDDKSVLIYHHSVYWEDGQQILKEARGKVVIRYHNVTPPEFFESYSQFHYLQCAMGRKQTQDIARQFPEAIWLCDSAYNQEDIMEVPDDRVKICPPFNKLSEWDSIVPEEVTLKRLIESKEIQLLFVGRIAPNKGHRFLLEIIRTFRANYRQPVKLNVIGKFDSELELYNEELRNQIAMYQLQDDVEFVGEMTDARMAAYYLGCDFFVCASEHEGFCVPILEAQYFGLPIIALKSCAVPDTGGEGQILLDKNEKDFAAAIHVLKNNGKYNELLRKKGFDNVEGRMAYSTICQCFQDFTEKNLELEW